MFIPTKQQLEELGFEKNNLWCYVLYEDDTKQISILYYDHPDDKFAWYFPSFFVNNISFYPRSLSDLKIIIESFNPN